MASSGAKRTPSSLSGAGVNTSPGTLNQAGGFDITDTGDDGFSYSGGGVVSITTNGQRFTSSIQGGGVGKFMFGIGPTPGFNVSVDANGVAYPFTITHNVNDQFIYTPIATGTPDTFTIAPGIYATNTELAAAVNAAVDGAAVTFETAFSGQLTATGTVEMYFENFGTAGDTLTSTARDALTAIGFTSPVTMVQGVGDQMAFFGATPVPQPAAPTTLAQVIAALVALGLVA